MNKEILILAVTRMADGIGLAGMTQDPDPVTGLRWVRPVREHGHLLPEDLVTREGEHLRPFDVVELNLIRPRPHLPHVEDWVTDFSRQRPHLLRRLEGERRTAFLHKYLDRAPEEVLQRQERACCLVKPDWIKGEFRLDGTSGKYSARMAFGLGPWRYLGAVAKGGLEVTDVQWRAWGRGWVPEEGGWANFDEGDLEARVGTQEVYLTVGLTPSSERAFSPIIAGVHTIPEYETAIDYDDL